VRTANEPAPCTESNRETGTFKQSEMMIQFFAVNTYLTTSLRLRG
jgi:hypothetical protein